MDFLKCLCPKSCSDPVIREGARLLTEIVKLGHASNRKKGVAFEAVMDTTLFDRLCLWQVKCENCENIEAVEADEDQDHADVESS